MIIALTQSNSLMDTDYSKMEESGAILERLRGGARGRNLTGTSGVE